MHVDLVKAARLVSVKLPALEDASKTSRRLLSQFKEVLKQEFSKNRPDDLERTDIVFLGSIAREEASFQSDFDYYVLQDGALPETTRRLITSAEKIRETFGSAQPGGQGVFGNIVVAANLYESIGLELDSNTNMTRRILLLSESKPVTEGKVHEKAIDYVLSRYCADYLNRSKNSLPKVPRYLLNDLVRYWRTMAVDFGTKRWRDSDSSSLRHAKLRITRKILFAGPLATVLLAPKNIKTNSKLQIYLKKSLAAPPLAQIARHVDLMSLKSQNAMKILLQNYDQFIGILSGDKREVLKGIKGDSKSQEELREQCREIGDKIQSSLEQIFYKDALFKNTFQKYAVF
ncbi:MAG: hypothetical protein JW837_10160 [Sedimentisphaerales bacterium]|nr:hypothetical protein [Sedimentisphaerales bacterium]